VQPEARVAPQIEYLVRRSTRARRSRLTITEDGEVVAVLPLGVPDRHADELLARHRTWAERHMARVRERRLVLAARPSLAAGRELLVAGRPVLVRAVSAQERAALERRLRRTARMEIERRVALRAPEVGVSVNRLVVRDQRTRWGSASRRGTLSFSWRLIMAPTEVLDYVVVHELAHLRVPGHGGSFWRLVEQHCPASAEARRWLRENQDALRHALD